METSNSRYETLIKMMKAFVSGADRSMEFVRKL